MTRTKTVHIKLLVTMLLTVLTAVACNGCLPAPTPGSDVDRAGDGLAWHTLPANYEGMTAAEKQKFLWEKRIKPTRYKSTLPELVGVDSIGLVRASMKTKMDLHSDVMPTGWKKVLHRYGSIATVRFESEAGHPYTGLFQGAQYGLMRMSLTSAPEDGHFNPGFALKLFVDGKPSQNVSALVSLDGQGENANLFAKDYSNVVPDSTALKLRVAKFLFSKASRFPTSISAADFSTVKQNGEIVTAPQFPARLLFRPNTALSYSGSANEDFRTSLTKLVPGSLLFTVYGCSFPNLTDEELREKTLSSCEQSEVKIGQIYMTSEFIASEFGDDAIFFKHQRFLNK